MTNHSYSKTRSDNSTHHARQPFFSKDIARQGSGLFFSQLSTPSVLQKKCAACETQDKQIQTKSNETFLHKKNLEEEEEVQTKLTVEIQLVFLKSNPIVYHTNLNFMNIQGS